MACTHILRCLIFEKVGPFFLLCELVMSLPSPSRSDRCNLRSLHLSPLAKCHCLLLFFEDPIIYVTFWKLRSGIEFPIIYPILQRGATNEFLSNAGSSLMKALLIALVNGLSPRPSFVVFWTYILYLLYYAHGSEPFDHFFFSTIFCGISDIPISLVFSLSF